MKKNILIIAFFSIGLLLFSFSSDDSTDGPQDEAVIDCTKLKVNNNENLAEVSVIDIPVDTFVFSLAIETPNTGQFVEVEILEQSPENSIKTQGGTGSVNSNNLTINFVAATSAAFNVNTGITGKIKVTIAETNCSQTIDFQITSIDPDDIF